ncbi:thiol:disulfide interchange protein DsbA/DsbL [Luteimonas sp. SX5]|uniref:Thiol:disulfide interchange protein DsbA/DsbL n=1 Tax=Luteimonas galliterrae TaxID=2940486 RepID=A0ABT0MLL0_9GAMM|nr:thiol:disulfide interchange protein DsbA/DsbL [Luteimonas galliterrae]MCL1635771.1 thiol:disulfide interchange protein DsbA/DsbL [Luteimonas galliterrae]
MTLRLALLLLALLPLTACKQAAPETAATAPETTAAAPTGSPVAGVDYIVIPNGQPYAAADGKVEVAEAFGYACPHCAHFEPLLKNWKATLPANARFVAVPATFGGPWDTYARGYFAAESLGLVDNTHEAVFNAIHGLRTLPPNASAEQIAAFYAQHGADAAAFSAAMASPAVDAKLEHVRQFLARAEVPGTADIGTPMIIVNGKYRIDAGEGGYEKMLDTAGKLVAQESASGG